MLNLRNNLCLLEIALRIALNTKCPRCNSDTIAVLGDITPKKQIIKIKCLRCGFLKTIFLKEK